jgi:hypothetical protein
MTESLLLSWHGHATKEKIHYMPVLHASQRYALDVYRKLMVLLCYGHPRRSGMYALVICQVYRSPTRNYHGRSVDDFTVILCASICLFLTTE